jgi:hypothetical protein
VPSNANTESFHTMLYKIEAEPDHLCVECLIGRMQSVIVIVSSCYTTWNNPHYCASYVDRTRRRVL